MAITIQYGPPAASVLVPREKGNAMRVLLEQENECGNLVTVSMSRTDDGNYLMADLIVDAIQCLGIHYPWYLLEDIIVAFCEKMPPGDDIDRKFRKSITVAVSTFCLDRGVGLEEIRKSSK